MHGLGIFAGSNGSPARSVLEFINGEIWHTMSYRVFTSRGFNIPLGEMTWFTEHRMDSIVRGVNGEPLVCANLINASLQFGQVLDRHHNFLIPLGFSEADLLAFYRRPNCLIAVFKDRQRGSVHVLAETTRNIPAYGEWLAGYPVETHTDPQAPQWLISDSVFNWIASSPQAQAQWIVRCVGEDLYDMDDISGLAFDFFRYDYRSIVLTGW